MYKVDDHIFLKYIENKISSNNFDNNMRRDFEKVLNTKMLTLSNVTSLMVYLEYAQTPHHEDSFIEMYLDTNPMDCHECAFEKLQEENQYIAKYLSKYFIAVYEENNIVIKKVS